MYKRQGTGGNPKSCCDSGNPFQQKNAEEIKIRVFTNISEYVSMINICKHSDKESTCISCFTEKLLYAERKRMRIYGRWLLRGAPKYVYA